VISQASKDQSGIQLEQSWTATSLDASMNASKPVSNCTAAWQFFYVTKLQLSTLMLDDITGVNWLV